MEQECDRKHGIVCSMLEKKLELHMGIVNSRLEAIKEATKIQTLELDRRLDILNGHQAELKSDRDQFVRYERYDDRVEHIDGWINRADKILNTLMADYERKISRVQIISIIAIFVAIASTALNLLLR